MAICRALDIKGGVNLHLLGPTPRYATRELMFVGIYPISSPRQTFSGTETGSAATRLTPPPPRCQVKCKKK
jgi:hypothetical protein